MRPKIKSKPIGQWTATELIVEKHNLLNETYQALDRGYYNSAHAYTRTLAKIDAEIKRRD